MTQAYYSHGKLLISGEYAVLSGALALALPTRPGQSLTVRAAHTPGIQWRSLDEAGSPWFETTFEKEDFLPEAVQNAGQEVRNRLMMVFNKAISLNPRFLEDQQGLSIETRLEFRREWGLGSSSTLINNMAQWAGVNAFELQKQCYGGSGYDIACAQQTGPITFQLKSGDPCVRPVAFKPAFSSHLYFVYLNTKQDTRRGIDLYNRRKGTNQAIIEEVSALTREFINAQHLADFERVMDEHEIVLSKILGLSRVKEQYFADFHGSIKSLGAWGGDFVLATGGPETPSYFKDKGYPTVIPYLQLIL